MRNTVAVFSLLALAAAVGFGQLNTSTMDGVISDPQGALVAKAQIVVTNTLTGQTFQTLTDDHGHWAIPALSTATYSVSATAPGFKKATKSDVKMDAGIPATVNLTLEVGAVSETVQVTGGAEVIQAASATVSTDLTGRQVSDLPIPSRNSTDLIVTLPGTQTPAGPRNTTFDGLPQGTVNMTLDGVNIQDNLLKNGSGGAFYPVVYPRTDAIEEVSVTTAAASADSLGEGAVQVKFVTKSGTNTWHGGTFIQERNTFFDANYYFNNINKLPRDRILLHQMGAHIGGPIRKNKLFIFFNYEIFRFPQTWNSGSQFILNPTAQGGVFTYKATNGQLQQVNLYQLAAANGYPSAPDPIIGNTLNQIVTATSSGGSLVNRFANNDYNRNTFTWLPPGEHKIDFPQGRLDYVINSKHQFSATGSVNPYRLFPDGINGIIPIFPGSGTVLGSSTNAGQREAFWSGSVDLRSSWTANLTSDLHFGMSSGNVLFSDGISDALFAPWRGYAPSLGFVTSPYDASSFSRRNDPLKQFNGGVSWTRSGHLFNFGGSFSQINEWVQGVGTQQIPRINFGVTSNDPILSIFNTANFPGITPTDLGNAESMYAMLTGRVSSITRSVVLGEQANTYGPYPAVDRVQQREWGIFAQDSWKVKPNLTLNYGARLENQNPYQVLNSLYTRPGYAGLYGISGVGNLFQPGASGGSTPVLTPVTSSSTTGYSPTHFVSPTVGIAYSLPKGHGGPLGWLLGEGESSVIRAGFSIATSREQLTNITGVWGGNQGRTISTTLDPLTNSPAIFGPAGSVLFSNPTLPVRTIAASPAYPLAVVAGTSLNDYNPDLKARYTESWNLGFQRPISPNTVLEIRYVGNRSARAWTTINLNEVNTIENRFAQQFVIAQNNLAIARAVNPNSNNFFNAGLAGQKDVPILQTALGGVFNGTLANLVAQGQAGTFASQIAGTASQMANLVNAGYPANLFEVNPATGGSGANLTTNQGGSTYNGLQVELRRRLSAGLQVGASYSWSHSLTTGSLLTLRDMTGVIVPSGFDERHAIKLNYVYELPIGTGHRLLGGGNTILRKAAEGWQLSGISRIQSGTPTQLTSGRFPFNTNTGGVILQNLTTAQLQSEMSIRKTTAPAGNGVLYFLPQSLINNSLAANQITGTLDPTQPYIAPPTTPGQIGNQVFLYGPWFQLWDVSLTKRTRIHESQVLEFRATALNIFNHPNFFLGTLGVNSGSFGQTTSAYNDINSTNNPGSRILEFELRFSF